MSSSLRKIVLGIDGGGTGTRAALLDDASVLLGVGEAGPSNYQVVGIEQATEHIGTATARAWAAADLEPRPCDAAFLGMAGVTSAADRATIAGIAGSLTLAAPERVGVDHDLRTALAGGLAGAPGIVLIAGTGSSCYGRRDDGRSWRAGGWGHLLDDVGGGYWMGVQGLIAITRAADGRGAPTALADLLTEALGIVSLDEILRRLHHEGTTRAEIAALAPLVLDAASAGDEVAESIVHQGAEELAKMVQAVAENLDWLQDSVAMTTVGGLTANGLYAMEIAMLVGKRAPHVDIVSPALPPVLGAALLALECAGVDQHAAAGVLVNEASQ